MFNSKIYTPLIYITYKRKQEEITKKCEVRFSLPPPPSQPSHKKMRSTMLRSVRRRHNTFFFQAKKMRSAAVRLCFAVPSGHTPLFASTSLCSFGAHKKMRSAAVRLCFAIKVFGKGVRGKNLSSERVFPAIFPLTPNSATLPERRRIHP